MKNLSGLKLIIIKNNKKQKILNFHATYFVFLCPYILTCYKGKDN